MQSQDRKKEELERCWKDIQYVNRWQRQRKAASQNFRQRSLRDAEGVWQRDPFPDSLDDNTPSSPVFAGPKARVDVGEKIEKSKRRRKGDPAFILPGSIVQDGVTKFPFAENAGACSEQLERASAMYKAGLTSKAKRAAHCGVIGMRRDCISNPDHRFFVPYGCGNRYCPHCGPQAFARLFAKHLLLEGTARSLVPHWPVEGHCPARVIAKVDFTVPNRGEMPKPEAVRKFNEDIRKFFRLLERRLGISRKEYGVLWADEFGGGNTNLHAHGVYAGPFLPQKKRELSRLWSEVVGEKAFVSIKAARSIPSALAHALKYTSKFVTRSTPERLAQLEKAFHRVRRVHVLARFYNVKSGDALEPGADGFAPNCCPLCGGGWMRIFGSHFQTISELKQEGLRNIHDVRLELGREKIGWQGLPP